MTINARSLSYYNVDLKDWYAPSGTYGILIGHVSDDIRLCGEIGFTTEKVLPMTVTQATTIGELLSNPVSGKIVGEMIRTIQSGDRRKETAEAESESDAKASTAMMFGMPLKSLVSFRVMTAEQLQAFMKMLNEKLAG